MGGWTRIGIVFTVLFYSAVIGIGAYEYNKHPEYIFSSYSELNNLHIIAYRQISNDAANAREASKLERCQSERPGSTRCELIARLEKKRDLHKTLFSDRFQLLMSLPMILWAVSFLGVIVGRWVKAGFEQNKPV